MNVLDSLKYLKNYRCSDIASIVKYNKYTDNNEYVRIFVYYLNIYEGIDEKYYKSKKDLIRDYFSNCEELNHDEKSTIEKIRIKKIKNNDDLKETEKELNKVLKEPKKRIRKRIKKVKQEDKEIEKEEKEIKEEEDEINELNEELKEINKNVKNVKNNVEKENIKTKKKVVKENIKSKKKVVKKKKENINKRKEAVKNELKDIKENVEKLDNVKKLVNNVKNCEYGTNTEQKARFDFEKNYMMKVLKNSNYKIFVKELVFDKNKCFRISGMVDGIIEHENKKYILEIKNRKNRIFNKIPLYEHIQLLIYSKLLNINNIIFLQKHNDKQKTDFILDFNDDELYNTIMKRLIDYTNLIIKLRNDLKLTMQIFNEGDVYDNISNYLTWLKPVSKCLINLDH